ncbi:protein kinase like protein, partial [Striga asiatica]
MRPATHSEKIVHFQDKFIWVEEYSFWQRDCIRCVQGIRTRIYNFVLGYPGTSWLKVRELATNVMFIFLELVTGRKPVERLGANEMAILGEFVRGKSLKGYAENEMIEVMKLGLVCTSEVASRRLSMAEAVQIKNLFDTCWFYT